MNKFKLMLALLAAPSMVLASCGPEQGEVDSGITSVSVSLAKTSLYEGETTKASANVKATRSVDKSVVWSSSNTAVATVDENGNVKALKKGSAKIIATSKVDNTKKGEKTLTVKEDQGFDPSWIEAGYAYSKTFPVSQIKAFLGSGDYDIVEPDSLEGGSYVKTFPADSYGPACVSVIIDGVNYESYAMALLQADFTRVYYAADGGLEAVDPTGKYTVAMYSDYDDLGDVAPTYLEFYKSEDVWDSPNITSDTEWSEDKIDSEDPYEISMIHQCLPNVPFVAMGEDYTIEWAYDYSELEEIIELLYEYGLIDEATSEEEIMEWAEYFGYEGPVEYLSIHDYSICEPFDGYDEVLQLAGYELVQDPNYGDYYTLIQGLDQYYLYFGFSYQGNYVEVEKYATILDAFPKAEVDSFVSNVIGSKYEVPAYEETEGAEFMAQVYEDEMDIMIDSAKISEFEAYKDKLELAGFEVEYSPADDDDTYHYYPYISATKGRIIVEMVLQQETGDSAYLDYGSVLMFIYADEEKHEEKGIYLPETTNGVLMAGSIELEPEMVDLDGANLSWESSNPEIATVDNGVVTMLAEGEVDITVTTDVEIPDVGGFYSASTHLVISAKPDFAPVLADLNDSLEYYGGTEVLSTDELPEIDCAEYVYFDGFGYYGCYVIQGKVSKETVASYTEKVEGLGFEVLTDEFDNIFYQTEEYDIVFNYFPEDEEGPAVFQVCVYFQEVTPEPVYDNVVITDYFSNEQVLTSIETDEGGSIVFSKSGGNNDPKCYSSDGARLYSGNTVTFTAPEGSYITAIEFEKSDYGTKSEATVTPSSGSYDDYYYSAPEGGVESVTFTVGASGQWRFSEFTIEYNGEGGGGGGGGEVESEFPMAKVLACLDGTTEEGFPIPTGTGFTFEESEDYYNDCFVGVEGGNLTAYLAALEDANFEIDDEYGDWGYYYCLSEGGTLEIDIEALSNSSFVLEIYSCVPPSQEFPTTEIKAFLSALGITNQSFPIPEGDQYVGMDDDDCYYVAVYGGDASAYMTVLKSAGYDIYDLGDGYYAAVKSDLEIDICDYGADVGFELYFGEVWVLY